MSFLGSVNAFLLPLLVDDLLLQGPYIFVHLLLLDTLLLNPFLDLSDLLSNIHHVLLRLLSRLVLGQVVVLRIQILFQRLVFFLKLIDHVLLLF